MALLESLVLGIGASVAKGVLKLWLHEDPLILSAGEGIAEALKGRFSDVLKRNAATREFDKIRDRSAKSFERTLKAANYDLSEDQLEKICNAAGAVLDGTELSAELLIKKDLNPEILTGYYLSRSGAEGGNPGFTNNDNPTIQQVYTAVLSQASQQIIDISSQLPNFTERVFAEMLERESRISDFASQVLDRMDDLLIIHKGVDPQSERFEKDYRLACARRFDRLELFGVDVHESNRRYKLTVAYITLNLEGADMRLTTENSGSDSNETTPANFAIRTKKRLLVRGQAGAGKTTLIQWAAVTTATKQHDPEFEQLNDLVPFVIQLRDFASKPLPNPAEFAQITTPYLGGVPLDWTHKMLSTGNAMVLVDGIDEVSEERRGSVHDWLRELIEQYPDCRFVATTRPHAVPDEWLRAEQFEDATLEDMQTDDISRFIDHWHEAIRDGLNDHEESQKTSNLSSNLRSEIQRNPDLQRLATSPLLCAMICALHRDRHQSLPTDRLSLYRACIEMFFRRDHERKISVENYVSLGDPEKFFLLQSFAWWLIRNDLSSASKVDAIKRMDKCLKELPSLRRDSIDGAKVVKLFVERTALLRSYDVDQVDFPHRTFQEYLAALEVSAELDLKLVVQNAHREQWREVAIMLAGIIENKEQAERYVMSLAEKGDEDAENRNSYYLIAAIAAKSLKRIPSDSQLLFAVSQRLRKIVPPKSLRSAQSLAKAGDLVVSLLEYRKSRNAVENAACVRTLALVGTQSALTALTKYCVDSRRTVLKQIELSSKYLNDELRPTLTQQLLRGLQSYLSIDRQSVANYVQMNDWDVIHDLTIIEAARNLVYLSIADCRNLLSLDGISSSSKLSELSLRNCEKLRSIAPLDGLTTLKSISLMDLPALDSLAALKELYSIDKCLLASNLPANAFDFLTEKHALTTLQLRGLGNCRGISRIALLQNLSSLTIQRCHAVESFDFLAGMNLKSLVISETLSTDDLAQIGKCSSLLSLEISGCTSLVDLSFTSGLTQLEHLVLTNCRELVSCDGIQTCTKLTTADFWNCTKISDILPIAECGTLTRVRFTGCPQVKSNIELLKSRLPNIRIH